MAQALLNNLTNTITDGIYSANSLQDNDSDISFDAILDAQQSAEDITAVDIAIDIIKEDLSTVIKETELAAAIEIAVDTVLNGTSEMTKGDSEDVLGVGEEISTEDTITKNEEPTMNKQLQAPLENPAASVLMQSQFNQKSQNVEDDKVLTNTNLINKDLINENANSTKNEIFEFTNPVKTQVKEDVSSSRTLKDIVDKNVVEDLNIESINGTSTTDSGSGNLMQYQTPQEQALKVILNGEAQFSEISEEEIINSSISKTTNTEKIIDQIAKQIEGMTNTSRLNIVLNPESLGKVTLQMVNSKNGLLAHFIVTNQDTQNLLMKGLAGLKESLLAQGINVEEVVVKLNNSTMDEGERNYDWTEQEGSRGGNKEQGSRKNKQDKKNFEQMMFEIEQG